MESATDDWSRLSSPFAARARVAIESEGRGLGLAVARRSFETAGGRLSSASRPDPRDAAAALWLPA